MDCSTPGFPVLHCLLEFAQIHVQWAGDAIQPSHPLLSLSPFSFNLSQHQDLFQWVVSLHQVAKVLKLQLQHQSCLWIFKHDFLKDWLIDFLAVQGTLKSFQHHNLKHQFFGCSAFFIVQLKHLTIYNTQNFNIETCKENSIMNSYAFTTTSFNNNNPCLMFFLNN